MSWKDAIFALAAVSLLPSGLLRADDRSQAPEPLSQIEADEFTIFPDGTFGASDELSFLTRGQSPYYRRQLAVRFGWWDVETHGNPAKVGEYQGLEPSSAFWDVDGLTSDGMVTADFFATGVESESTQAGLYVYRPMFSVDVDFQRFIHRLDHDSGSNFPYITSNGVTTPPIPGGTWFGEFEDDFQGQDYAIRVQEFEADFKGKLTDNVRWRLNVWGMRKYGERQARSFAHNCTGSSRPCHLLNQRQQIDWLTTQIEPVIEARIGAATIEYSRTMRTFNQNDGLATRQYANDRHSRAIRPFDRAGQAFDYPYGVVPENYTQIDRIKLGIDLTENTHFYGNAFFGNTENRKIDTNRTFNGFDLRVVNRSVDGVTVTGYAKRYDESNQMPSEATRTQMLHLDNVRGWTLDDDFSGAADDYNTRETLLDDFRIPTNRQTDTAGAKVRWKPFGSWRGFALNGGYEYRSIRRQNATYPLNPLYIDQNQVEGGNVGGPPPEAPNGGDLQGYTHFTQPDTFSNLLHVGTSMRLGRSTDIFVRYKMREVSDPMYGFNEGMEDDPAPPNRTLFAQALNTNLPQHEDLIEFGGTWAPTHNLMVNATIGIQKRNNVSNYANYVEDDYPVVLSAWYALNDRWSLSGGLASFTNFIDQDITIGKGHDANVDIAQDIRFNYGGRADLINFGAAYAATDCLSFSGSVEHVRSENSFSDPSIPGLSLSYLPGATDVLVETTRLSAGVDYLLTDGVGCYFRYDYYQWDDLAGNGETGGTNMFLAGVSGVY